MMRLAVVAAVLTACLVALPVQAQRKARVEWRGGRVYIVDMRGERFDVTEADARGFRPEEFQYGIGRYAIPPVDTPQFLTPEDPSWTRVPDTLEVIGVVVSGQARAYPIGLLSRHEIANESIAGKSLAVAY